MVHLVHQSLHVGSLQQWEHKSWNLHQRPHTFSSQKASQKRAHKTEIERRHFWASSWFTAFPRAGLAFYSPADSLPKPHFPRSSCGTVIIPIIAMVCRTLTAMPAAMVANWRGAGLFGKHYRQRVLLLFSDLLVKRAIFHLKHWSDKFGTKDAKMNCEYTQVIFATTKRGMFFRNPKKNRTLSGHKPGMWTFGTRISWAMRKPLCLLELTRAPERSQNLCPYYSPFWRKNYRTG